MSEEKKSRSKSPKKRGPERGLRIEVVCGEHRFTIERSANDVRELRDHGWPNILGVSCPICSKRFDLPGIAIGIGYVKTLEREFLEDKKREDEGMEIEPRISPVELKLDSELALPSGLRDFEVNEEESHLPPKPDRPPREIPDDEIVSSVGGKKVTWKDFKKEKTQ